MEQRHSDPQPIDPERIDAQYQQFPDFSAWADCKVDVASWDRYASRLETLASSEPATLRRALEVVSRAAAVDTGALEGLYETDRGLTITIATQAAMWETALAKKGEKAQRLIETQLRAYDYILDFSTGAEPIGEAWIRQLQAKICEGQDTYRVWTELGLQDLPLPLGRYKTSPNHVLRADNSVHAYAPVEATPIEMHRLVEELRSPRFLSAHPVLQASYSHYALVVIHPFPDGNGRTARALASVFLYRSNRIPLLILSGERDSYLRALESADNGDYQAFVDFVFLRGCDAIQLAEESLKSATLPRLEDASSTLQGLYVTRGGYRHDQVDGAACRLLSQARDEVERLAAGLRQRDQFTTSVEFVVVDSRPPSPDHRSVVANEKKAFRLVIEAKPPATARVEQLFCLAVPRDCARDDEVLIWSPHGADRYSARAVELIPTASSAVLLRLRVWAERVLTAAIQQVTEKAKGALRSSGL